MTELLDAVEAWLIGEYVKIEQRAKCPVAEFEAEVHADTCLCERCQAESDWNDAYFTSF